MANESFTSLEDYVLVISKRHKFPVDDFLQFIGRLNPRKLL